MIGHINDLNVIHFTSNAVKKRIDESFSRQG